MPADVLDRLRTICLALPETSEKLSHGAPTFFAGKKTFVMFVDNHHDDGRLAMWLGVPEGAREQLISGDPARFFVPPYVGTRGWIGVILSNDPDWGLVEDMIEDSYRAVALKRMLAALDS